MFEIDGRVIDSPADAYAFGVEQGSTDGKEARHTPFALGSMLTLADNMRAMATNSYARGFALGYKRGVRSQLVPHSCAICGTMLPKCAFICADCLDKDTPAGVTDVQSFLDHEGFGDLA